MKKQLYIFTTLTLLLLSLNTFAQRNSTYQYYGDGWWTLGITGGAAWQGSDICAMPGWGVGIDLAKNIYHRPNGLLDFDLRGRALYTRSFGADPYRSYGILNNDALNGTEDSQVNYTTPTGPGYTFLNHRTDIGELSVEGVLTANRLRERTGFVLQGFGGIGINGYHTGTDQLDGQGNMYNWTSIDTTGGRFSTIADLNRDRSYETWADGYDNHTRLSIMPSLGLGLGYDLTRNFTVGIEHKTTWALNDKLDGQIYNQYNNSLSDNNDRYNYTSLYLRWRIGGKNYHDAHPTTNAPIQGGTSTYPVTPSGIKPIITFTNPRKEVSTSTQQTSKIVANIENVNGRRDITVTLNDRPFNDFSYNPRTDKLGTNIRLEKGTNQFTITATNSYGEAIDSRIIILEDETATVYTPPVVTNNGNNNPNTNAPNPSNPPQVNITSPTANPYTSNDRTTRIRASVKNISNKNQVDFRINGQRTNNFEMGYLGGTITADIPLNSETTNVKISVQNSDGSDSDTQTIIYREPYVGGGNTGGNAGSGLRPNVDITTPAANPFNSTENTVNLTAYIKNISSQNAINFQTNGQRSNNFNYNAASGKLTATIPLNVERTLVTISASNNYGTDADEVTLVYCPPYQQAPVVDIFKPMDNPYTTDNAIANVKATVRNVNGRADINVKINNLPILNFDYDDATSIVTFNANLRSGNNTIQVKGTNNVGTDRDETVIIYQAIQKPVVDIIKPGLNPYTSPSDKAVVIATIENVDNRSDISFKIKGRASNDFEFNAASGQFIGNVPLENGDNLVVISATNAAGSDSDDVTIKYSRGRTVTDNTSSNPTFSGVQKPSVNIVKPSIDPYTSPSDKAVVIATIENVNNRSNITFKINGKRSTDFEFNAAQNSFVGNIDLSEGDNKVVIKAQNGNKSDSDDITIKYGRSTNSGQFGGVFGNPNAGEPRTAPTTTPTTTSETLGKGKRNNRKNDKSDATDRKTTMPRGFTSDLQKPTIQVVTPNALLVTTQKSTEEVAFKVTDTKQEKISIYVNGKRTDDFEFNKKKGEVTLSIDLKAGPNIIKIEARNKKGIAKESINFVKR